MTAMHTKMILNVLKIKIIFGGHIIRKISIYIDVKSLFGFLSSDWSIVEFCSPRRKLDCCVTRLQ